MANDFLAGDMLARCPADAGRQGAVDPMTDLWCELSANSDIAKAIELVADYAPFWDDRVSPAIGTLATLLVARTESLVKFVDAMGGKSSEGARHVRRKS